MSKDCKFLLFLHLTDKHCLSISLSVDGIDYPYLSPTFHQMLIAFFRLLSTFGSALGYSELHTILIHRFLCFTAKQVIGITKVYSQHHLLLSNLASALTYHQCFLLPCRIVSYLWSRYSMHNALVSELNPSQSYSHMIDNQFCKVSFNRLDWLFSISQHVQFTRSALSYQGLIILLAPLM